MTDIVRVLAQVEAHRRRRAVPLRATSTLTPDPPRVFAVAPVRVVAEQRVQALAFGVIGSPPQIVALWNPLSRDTGELEPFANALNGYLANNNEPRIWLAHPHALEILDLLGHRYATNQRATPSLRRMGAQCRAIVDEAEYSGQQIVAVAGTLLREHVATGQSAVEDQHLGALLPWISPPSGSDPAIEAARRALLPAAAMLSREADDRVENLRRIAKRGGSAGLIARQEIEQLLYDGSVAEWNLLVEGRNAFWSLHLEELPQGNRLMDISRDRFGFAITALHSRPVNPHTLSKLLDAQELAQDIAEDNQARGDAGVREQLRMKGRVVRMVVTARDQARANTAPCVLHLHTKQEVLRIRLGTSLKTLDMSISGRVIAVRNDPVHGGTILEFNILRGIRAATRLRRLERVELLDTVVVDVSFRKRKAYDRLGTDQPALVYGDVIPVPNGRTLSAESLDVVVRRLRRV